MDHHLLYIMCYVCMYYALRFFTIVVSIFVLDSTDRETNEERQNYHRTTFIPFLLLLQLVDYSSLPCQKNKSTPHYLSTLLLFIIYASYPEIEFILHNNIE